MIPLYKSPKVNVTLPSELNIKQWLIMFVIGLTASVQTFSQELVFKDPVLESGTLGQNGAIYRFSNVITGIDALVEIKGRSDNNVVLETIDESTQGWGKALQPKLGRADNVLGFANWWMEFELRFVKEFTTQDANVTKFDITALDVDGDGLTIKEYVEFYKTKTCLLENITQLLATPLGSSSGEKDYRMTGPILNFLNIDTAATAVMTTAKYENKTKIKFRFGGEALGLGISNAGMRFNSLWFRSFNYAAPRTLPVVLSSFNAALSNSKVALTWTTDQEKNASHFVVQRSKDGIEFTDAGIIFTEGNSETTRSYNFRDPMPTNGKGVLYYRLKMVDLDGRFEYSSVKLVKLGDNGGKLELQTFPNPVVNELRITIPEGWQNKQVIYEIYTMDGQLMKRSLNKSATQTETVSMQFYQPGTYIIKALNDKEIATQRVVKRK